LIIVLKYFFHLIQKTQVKAIILLIVLELKIVSDVFDSKIKNIVFSIKNILRKNFYKEKKKLSKLVK